MNLAPGLIIEGLIAVSLLGMAGYCLSLNLRLKRLEAEERSMKATIGELFTATETAERAIGGLKQAVRTVNGDLGKQIANASKLTGQLGYQLSQGESVVQRLSRIASAARSPQSETMAPTSARAIAVAAQAFADRMRSDGLAA